MCGMWDNVARVVKTPAQQVPDPTQPLQPGAAVSSASPKPPDAAAVTTATATPVSADMDIDDVDAKWNNYLDVNKEVAELAPKELEAKKATWLEMQRALKRNKIA